MVYWLQLLCENIAKNIMFVKLSKTVLESPE